MGRIMNKPEHYYMQMSLGMKAAGEDYIDFLDESGHMVIRAHSGKEKTAVVAVCDGGHMPMYQGYVGYGLLDGCVIGDIFKSPSAAQIEETARYCDKGRGIFILYGYDIPDMTRNVEMAVKSLIREGRQAYAFVVHDNAMNIPPRPVGERSSTPGSILLAKIAGAAAEEGYSLDEIVKAVGKASDKLRSMGAVARFCEDPLTGQCKNQIAEGFMNIGGCFHGEKGFETIPFPPADIMAEHMFRKMINLELDVQPGDHAVVMVTGLGATPLESLYTYYKTLKECLLEKEVVIRDALIGNYGTSLDTNGLCCSIMVMDEETEHLYKAPVDTMVLHKPGVTAKGEV